MGESGRELKFIPELTALARRGCGESSLELGRVKPWLFCVCGCGWKTSGGPSSQPIVGLGL